MNGIAAERGMPAGVFLAARAVAADKAAEAAQAPPADHGYLDQGFVRSRI